jgi:UDP-N-acetylmuramyl pentapeptide phosphotransferase/UDP-N-acetylglucosamine-1-phosphate transferase
MVQIVIGAILSFLLAFFIMPFVIKIARIKNLYDIPDERKTHSSPVPSLGGLGIFIGLIISLLLTNDFTSQVPEFQYYIAAFFIMFILGVLDDIFVLTALKKITGQFIVAGILTVKAHLLITNLHGFLGIDELSTGVSYTVTFFAIVGIVNSFNLIDGVDGLAGSLALLTSLCFGVFLFINNDLPHALLAFTIAGALIAFLIYNFHPAKIFMGDSGSMLIGLVNAILVIRFIQSSTHFSFIPVTSTLAIGAGILLLPVMDVLRVFCIRLSKGQSPFAPDRNHLHHLLLNKGFSHTKVTVTLLLMSSFFSIFSMLFQTLNITLEIVSLLVLFFICVGILRYAAPRGKLLRVVADKDAQDENKNIKIVPIYSSDKAAVIEEE